MSNANRPPEELTQNREERAWLLRQQFWTEERIARDLGVTQQAVSKMLKRVRVRLAKEFKDRAEEIKAEQTTQLSHIADEAMQAWHKSRENAEMTRTITREVGEKKSSTRSPFDREDDPVGGEPVTVTETTFESKGQSGNASHLREAREALGDIRKIWGLDAPAKVAATTPDGEEAAPFAIVRMPAKMTPEEWAQHQQQEQQAQQSAGAKPS